MFVIDQPYTIVLMASVIISISMAVSALMLGRNSGVYAFSVLKAAIGLWALFSLFEICSKHLETKIFAYSFKYVFIVLVPVVWYIFGAHYPNRLRKLSASQITMLMIVPVTTILLVVTNHFHQFMFTSLDVVQTDTYLYVVRDFGIWFWIHTAYSYTLLLMGFVPMVKHLIDSPAHHPWQVATLLAGGFSPWAANMMFTFKLLPDTYPDPTPFAFTISGVAVMVGTLRFKLFDLAPMARDVVVQNIEDGIIVVDRESRIRNLNPAAKHLAGAPESQLIGAKAQETFPWWNQLNIANPENRETISDIELFIGNKRRLLRPRTLPLFSHKRKIGQLITLHNVTEERELQYQLFQSQKMQAIGTLAGGITHDFNNLLMGMQANLSLMHLKARSDPELRDKIHRIEDQIKSGANLAKQLLGYARKGEYLLTTVDLNRLIEETLTVIQRTNKSITIQRRFREEPILIKADRNQIEMVLLNLFVNAKDAMPQGGRLTVSTRTVNQSDVFTGNGCQTQYCELVVADTGVGMDPAHQKRIFEPFFTTKEIGQGTGLGLTSVYGVVQHHGGTISVDSVLKEGTTFTLYLPMAEGQEDVAARSAAAQPCPVGPRGMDAGILLVEDEPLIRKFTFEMLRSLRFNARQAQNGREAIDIYNRSHDEIDLVILDMIMPGMDGLKVYQSMIQTDPNLKVIVTSGYISDKRIDEILQDSCCHIFLEKPYTRDELAQNIKRVLWDPPSKKAPHHYMDAASSSVALY
jgi:signal transduction histidine kinase/CheY-like chemotaxis protein